jgi:hypothetical protein
MSKRKTASPVELSEGTAGCNYLLERSEKLEEDVPPTHFCY